MPARRVRPRRRAVRGTVAPRRRSGNARRRRAVSRPAVAAQVSRTSRVPAPRLEFAHHHTAEDQRRAGPAHHAEAFAGKAAEDAGEHRFRRIDQRRAGGGNRPLRPVHRKLDEGAGDTQPDAADPHRATRHMETLAGEGHGDEPGHRHDHEIEHRDPSGVDALRIAADQDDLAREGDSARQRHPLAPAEPEGTTRRVGDQHQSGEGKQDADPAHDLRRAAQHRPLDQRNERHIERREKGRHAG